jgi:hypothetical protein
VRRFSVSIQKLPSGKYRAVVRQAGLKRNGKSFDTRREAAADEARIRLEMGARSDEGTDHDQSPAQRGRPR